MSERRYTFYLETEKGTCLQWDGLTLLEAKKMYNLTDKRESIFNTEKIKTYGWEEKKQ